MSPDASLVRRFHQVLVDEIRRTAPEYVSQPFTVAEIYQSLVPYRTHRDQLGVEQNGDYEMVLLRFLGGEEDLAQIQSETAQARIRRELEGKNPNTGLYREFAAVEVRLNDRKLPDPPAQEEVVEEDVAPEPETTPVAPPTLQGDAPTACPDCDAALPDRDSLRFCPFCGTNVFIMPCGECGEVLERDWLYCVACGTPTED